MRRREVLLLAGGFAALPARIVQAQAPQRQFRIAVLQPALSAADWRKLPVYRSLFPELRHLGEVEGQNLMVEYFTAEGQVERYADLARMAAGSNPDVIVTVQTMLPALMSVTHTIPIVASFGALLLSVTSLAQPGRNLTGVSTYSGIEERGKQLQLLREAVPSAKRVAFVSTQFEAKTILSEVRKYATSLGMSPIEVPLRDASAQEIERGFAEIARQHADAMLLSPEGPLIQHARLIVRLAQENRVPAMYPLPPYAELGGLTTYAFEPGELARQLADDLHRILHGAKPEDIPIYQPFRFKLTLNLNAAKAIGLTFPPSILAAADEVIE